MAPPAAHSPLGFEPAGHTGRPRRPELARNTLPSFAAAVAMHALLVLGMWFAVQWRTTSDSPAVAELWEEPAPTAVQPAVVPPPPPQPPPPQAAQPEADIVIPQKVKPKSPAEETPPPAERRPPSKPAPRKPQVKQPSPQELEREKRASEERRQAELARLAGQVGGTARAPSAGAGPISNTYKALINACIRPNIVFAVPSDTSPAVYAEFELELLPTGEQASPPRLVKPSGLPGYDDAAERAIIRCDPFPRDSDGTVPRNFKLKMYPTETR